MKKNEDMSLYDINCDVYLLKYTFCKNRENLQISQKKRCFCKKEHILLNNLI